MELLLNYEGAVQHPLAIGSIDNFLLELAVHPATLQVGRDSGWSGGWHGMSQLSAVLVPVVWVLACGWVPCSVCADGAVPAVNVVALLCVQLHTSLGNMVVEYGALPKSNPNRTMLSVRDKQAGSLIDVMFK